MGRILDATPKDEREIFGDLLSDAMKKSASIIKGSLREMPGAALMFACFYVKETTVNGKDLLPAEVLQSIPPIEEPDPGAVDLTYLAIEMMEAGEFQPPEDCLFSKEDFISAYSHRER